MGVKKGVELMWKNAAPEKKYKWNHITLKKNTLNLDWVLKKRELAPNSARLLVFTIFFSILFIFFFKSFFLVLFLLLSFFSLFPYSVFTVYWYTLHHFIGRVHYFRLTVLAIDCVVGPIAMDQSGSAIFGNDIVIFTVSQCSYQNIEVL